MIKKVLVSQPEPATGKSPYYDIAEKYKLEVVFRPFIKIERTSAKEFRQQKVNLADYTAVIFTSRHAIDHFFSFCSEFRVKVPDMMKYFCVTEQVSLYIQKYVQYRKRKVFFGQSGKIEDLAHAISKHNYEKFITPMSETHSDEIGNFLDKLKVKTHAEAVMYRTVNNDFDPNEPFDYDMLLFFSPAGIQSLQKNFPDFQQGDIQIGTFGAATAQAVRDAGYRLDLEAPTPESPSMTAALEKHLKESNK
ncbi:MAG: uroporphyrinogen-III synthase [Prevotellaceae bacterium]|jgi:uroporphyrinogen-III synthase|nr:uroporphyrinogen-III synthase [Prevotellaceae bacterium]